MAGEFNSISGRRGRDFYLCDPIFTSGGFLSYEYVYQRLIPRSEAARASHKPLPLI
jgi:hypothetical protein